MVKLGCVRISARADEIGGLRAAAEAWCQAAGAFGGLVPTYTDPGQLAGFMAAIAAADAAETALEQAAWDAACEADRAAGSTYVAPSRWGGGRISVDPLRYGGGRSWVELAYHPIRNDPPPPMWRAGGAPPYRPPSGWVITAGADWELVDQDSAYPIPRPVGCILPENGEAWYLVEGTYARALAEFLWQWQRRCHWALTAEGVGRAAALADAVQGDALALRAMEAADGGPDTASTEASYDAATAESYNAVAAFIATAPWRDGVTVTVEVTEEAEA